MRQISKISKMHPDIELSDKHVDIAKTMSMIYNGEKVDYKLELLDIDVDKSKNNVSP